MGNNDRRLAKASAELQECIDSIFNLNWRFALRHPIRAVRAWRRRRKATQAAKAGKLRADVEAWVASVKDALGRANAEHDETIQQIEHYTSK